MFPQYETASYKMTDIPEETATRLPKIVYKKPNVIAQAYNKDHSHDSLAIILFFTCDLEAGNFKEKTAKSIIAACTCCRWIIDCVSRIFSSLASYRRQVT